MVGDGPRGPDNQASHARKLSRGARLEQKVQHKVGRGALLPAVG